MIVHFYFEDRKNVVVYEDVKYTSYSSEWYSLVLNNGITHRYNNNKIKKIVEFR